jgi:CheY-like chemotaxis protein
VADVLVVEDEPDILRLVKIQLHLSGHRATGAESAQEALDIIARQGPPDVLILDVAMPRMNGLELLRRLRAREGMEHLPAIFLSARAQPDDVAAGEALGALYLTKPFADSDLVEAVDRVLRGRGG